MEQSWFVEVVLWSGLHGTISVQLVVGPCKGYARRILNLTQSFFNNTNYQVLLYLGTPLRRRRVQSFYVLSQLSTAIAELYVDYKIINYIPIPIIYTGAFSD